MRHTTFRFALSPSPVQAALLARHAGASRFAYNQCLRLVNDALAARRADPQVRVPWSGFDLINAINAWKRSEGAGRVFVVAPDGKTTVRVTGLAWRHEVAAQVFEEAAVDFGRALAAYAATGGASRQRRIGFPRCKRKGRCRDSFRLRNRANGVRVGDDHPRSVTLPSIGTVRVHDDTRRLRRLLGPIAAPEAHPGQGSVAPRARILYATVSRHGSRWYVSLTIYAPAFHAERRHQLRGDRDHGGWVGLDRGLAAFVVAATSDGAEVGRWPASRPLQQGRLKLRQRSRAVARTRPGSRNRAKATLRASRANAHIANVRRHFLHEISSRLVQTHDRLCLEDLAVANLIANRHLARAITDAGWAEFARRLRYKSAWSAPSW
jgi:putative transposase